MKRRITLTRIFIFAILLTSSLVSKDSLELVRAKGQLMQEGSLQARGEWVGYYHGVLPCSNCKGVETWLHLKKNGNRGTYEMKEKYYGVKNRHSKGGLGWLKGGKVAYLTLYNNRKLAIKSRGVTFLNDPKGTLRKVDSFKVGKDILLVDPKGLLTGKMKGEQVIRFKGLTNFDQAREQGYRSFKADYLIKCRSKQYELTHVSYYIGRYSMRGFVYTNVQKTKGKVSDSALIQKAYKRYCR